MDNILFYFAGMPVYFYGFLTSLGLLLGTISALSQGRRRGISWYKMFDFILGTAVVFFIAGRVSVLIGQYGFVAFLRPWKIFTEMSGGLNTKIGLIFAVIYGFLSAVRHKIFGLSFLDAITPAILIIRIFSSLGSTVFGRSTSVPWAIHLGELRLHPLPLYAALGYYLIYFIEKHIRRNLRFEGQVFISAFTTIIWLHWILLFVSETEDRIWFWLYPLLGILGTALWSFCHANSPITRTSHRGVVFWLFQFVVFGIVVFFISSFFYSRFV